MCRWLVTHDFFGSSDKSTHPSPRVTQHSALRLISEASLVFQSLRVTRTPHCPIVNTTRFARHNFPRMRTHPGHLAWWLKS